MKHLTNHAVQCSQESVELMKWCKINQIKDSPITQPHNLHRLLQLFLLLSCDILYDVYARINKTQENKQRDQCLQTLQQHIEHERRIRKFLFKVIVSLTRQFVIIDSPLC